MRLGSILILEDMGLKRELKSVVEELDCVNDGAFDGGDAMISRISSLLRMGSNDTLRQKRKKRSGSYPEPCVTIALTLY